MNSLTRARIARSLRGAAQILDAGIVAYPTVMADSIMAHVRHAAASWYLGKAIEEKKAVERYIAVLEGAADATLPLPMKKLPKAVAEFLAEYLEERHDDPEWADRVYTDLTSRTAAKLTGLGVIDVDAFEVMKAGKHFYFNSDSMALADLSDDWLRLLSYFLYDAYDLFGADNNAAYKASKAIDDHLRAKKKLADKQADGSATPKFDAARIADAKEALASLEQKEAFFRTMTKKASKVIRHEFSFAFDPTGLPESYPIDRTAFQTKVVFLISKKLKKFGGRWNNAAKKMELVLPNTSGVPNDAQFARWMSVLRTTTEHELAHMVQYLMQEGMRDKERQAHKGDPTYMLKQEGAKRAGTPYSPRQAIPKRAGNAAEKGAYPKASEKERYYLDPIEFFPQVISWTNWFIKDHVPERWVQMDGGGPGIDPILRKWKEYVGLAPATTVAVGNFFASLKKHDTRLWKRAVAEGWRLLKEKTQQAKPQVLRTTKQLDEVPVGTKVANEAGKGRIRLTKTAQGWSLDDTDKVRTSAELADAVKHGMRLGLVAASTAATVREWTKRQP